jgi:hypothetical protein
MMPFSGQRRLKWRIWPCILVLGLTAAALNVDSQMIAVGNQGLFFPVANGDIISHEFIHSMYDVRVIERFRIENGWLHLFHVDSESNAALEYYGIDNRRENNVNRRIREFRIPVGSIGSHALHVRNQTVSLGVSQTSERCIFIRLSSRPAVVNWAYSLWR